MSDDEYTSCVSMALIERLRPRSSEMKRACVLTSSGQIHRREVGFACGAKHSGGDMDRPLHLPPHLARERIRLQRLPTAFISSTTKAYVRIVR